MVLLSKAFPLMTQPVHPLDALLTLGIEKEVYPGAVLLASTEGRIRFLRAVGNRSILPRREALGERTIFDLASLTKPLATTLAAMKLAGDGRMDLDRPITVTLPAEVPKDKAQITPRMLLNHSAGFPAWRPFYRELMKYRPQERKARLRDLALGEPLVFKPGSRCLYSDLGFITLEWALESACGAALSEYLRQTFYGPLALTRSFLWSDAAPSPHEASEFASTEACLWRNRVIRGEVHDENAYAAGGYAGHAGLFGTSEEVHLVADMLRSHYRGDRADFLKPVTVREFFVKDRTPEGATWALGWDTPSERGSSAGRYFSRRSVGHLGYTGTSLWMDLEKDAIVVFLTNRVHPNRSNEKIREFRPLVHDAVMAFCGLDRKS